ncbi:MAG: MurR/RpiR family transcriptional regulator [bacterium]|nr:MAG: MurR/RpiR family transcriptional regulator [bacterium]
MENYYKMSDVLSVIRSGIEDLRSSERKVAEYVLKNPETVITLSITDLAEEAGTSEPTVIRFCRKLGLKGFMDLKLGLARDLPSSQYIHESVSEGDTLPRIFNKMLKAAKEAINDTMNGMDMELLEKASQLLASARRIEFYGVGGSGAVARDAQHKFFRLGIPCLVYDDPHMQAMSAALLGPGDVVVAVSHTGSTKDILDSVRIAREAGAAIIGITGHGKSPLARICDVALAVHSKEAALRLAPMTSRLAQLAVIDVLFVSVAMRNYAETKERLNMVKRSLVDKRP